MTYNLNCSDKVYYECCERFIKWDHGPLHALTQMLLLQNGGPYRPEILNTTKLLVMNMKELFLLLDKWKH